MIWRNYTSQCCGSVHVGLRADFLGSFIQDDQCPMYIPHAAIWKSVYVKASGLIRIHFSQWLACQGHMGWMTSWFHNGRNIHPELTSIAASLLIYHCRCARQPGAMVKGNPAAVPPVTASWTIFSSLFRVNNFSLSSLISLKLYIPQIYETLFLTTVTHWSIHFYRRKHSWRQLSFIPILRSCLYTPSEFNQL